MCVSKVIRLVGQLGWECSMEVKVEKKQPWGQKKVDQLKLDEKCSHSMGKNDQLVHWWVMGHSSPIFSFICSYKKKVHIRHHHP